MPYQYWTIVAAVRVVAAVGVVAVVEVVAAVAAVVVSFDNCSLLCC